MPIYTIEGLEIDFPFEPYQCQEDYIRAVTKSLQNGYNALLESPTGTGKTLCLLTSTLAWRNTMKNPKYTINNSSITPKIADWDKHQALPIIASTQGFNSGKRNVEVNSNNGLNALALGIEGDHTPKIIYSSRTHSQLTQVINELKNTAYRPKISILASREQLCIHPQVSKAESNAQRTYQCGALVSTRSCSYYNKVEEIINTPELTAQPMDIEDLVKFGHSSGACPYYINKKMYDSAEITFMPYNYVIDSKIRNHLKINLDNSVVIIDEGHNINSVCESTSSFDLSAADLAGCIQELGDCFEMADTIPKEELSQRYNISKENIGVVKNWCHTLEMHIAEEILEIKVIPGSTDKKPKVESGMDLYRRFENAGVCPYNDEFEIFLGFVQSAYDILQREPDVGEDGDPLAKVTTQMKGVKLKHLGEILRTLMHRSSDERSTFAANYKTILQPVLPQVPFKSKGRKQKTTSWNTISAPSKEQEVVPSTPGWNLSYWCFSSRYAMKELQSLGVRNILITSGTLSPMAEFAAEMAVPFPTRLSNSHVIQKNQIWVGCIQKGPSGIPLNSSYKNRQNESYINDLGLTILHVCETVPDGVLVFFPSYGTMAGFIDQWKKVNSNSGGETLWQKINRYKPAVVEPRGKSDFQVAMSKYYADIGNEKGSGASFFAVTRGKVSEGLDFADANGRAVIITGLPFPALMDLRVNTKRQFMDDIAKKDKEMPSGSTWYKQEAMRAVNQAIGRVIRHRNDFGAILFCDERFSFEGNKQDISSWVRPSMVSYDEFSNAKKSLEDFFRAISLDNANGVGVGGAVTRQKYPKTAGLTMMKTMPDGPTSSMSANVFTRKRHARSGIIEYEKKDSCTNADEYDTNGGRDIFSLVKAKSVTTFTSLVPKEGLKRAAQGPSNSITVDQRQLKQVRRKPPNSLFGSVKSTKTFESVEAEIAVRVPTQAELQGSKPYITEVKRVKQDQYKNFIQVLLDAKKGTMTAAQLTERVKELFGDTPHLLKSFRQFVPGKYLPVWDERVLRE
eukprot:CFRG6495T1